LSYDAEESTVEIYNVGDERGGPAAHGEADDNGRGGSLEIAAETQSPSYYL
jgi:hypothetical protein